MVVSLGNSHRWWSSLYEHLASMHHSVAKDYVMEWSIESKEASVEAG